jgi:hypothetical protein
MQPNNLGSEYLTAFNPSYDAACAALIQVNAGRA